MPNPKRWDLRRPDLYVGDGPRFAGATQVVDVYDQPFGFRTIEFTPRDGFKLNGRRVPLYGTCNHHDLGPLGAALNVRALERQLEILKEMGCNALRTSHNPPAPELLDLADRMGFVVMVEAFDCWKRGKTRRRLQQALRRVAREGPAGHGPARAEPSQRRHVEHRQRDRRAERARRWRRCSATSSTPRTRPDPSRPAATTPAPARTASRRRSTSSGSTINLGDYKRILDHPGQREQAGAHGRVVVVRQLAGEYFFPVKRGRDSQVNFQVSSYDVDAPPWAQPPDEVFEALDKNPAFFGEFVWTGFDYLGEPTPYNSDVTNLLNFSDPEKRAAMKEQLDAIGKLRVPSASSYFGIVDLCGFKKDRFYIYQARWRPDLPMAHILPHWNWPERVGQVTPVHVYTSGDEAELFLDGKSLGRKKKGPFEYRLRWDDVVYQPGELSVVAYRDGKEWARDRVKTTGRTGPGFALRGSVEPQGRRPRPRLRHRRRRGQGGPHGPADPQPGGVRDRRPGPDRRGRQRGRRQPRAVPGPAAEGLQWPLPGDRGGPSRGSRGRSC